MPTLFDPAAKEAPLGAGMAELYLHSMAAIGVDQLIPNVRTKLMGLRIADRTLPITINCGERGGSYVCEPYSAYILYARRELEIVVAGLEKWLFVPIIWLSSLLLRAARINTIVHVDNWLLSTNLHGDWKGEDIGEIRRYLQRLYPEHIIAIRSLDRWSSNKLLDSAIDDGWSLYPSRQIWVTQDMRKQWQPRNNTRHDRRLMNKGEYCVQELSIISNADAERIEALYAMLYLDKYSELNPAFSARWIQETCRIGLIHYRCARNKQGVIDAVSGSFQRGDIMTPPVVGYDTVQPRSCGLYRIATLLFSEEAFEQGLGLNGSAGASSFKKFRGAEAEIEYSAYFIAHLSLFRRIILTTLSFVLNHIAVPYMRKHQL